MIRIFTDTSANLPKEWLERYELDVIPFSFSVNGVPSSEKEFEGKAYYDAMRAGADVKTSMVNSVELAEPMRKALEAGEDVIYIGMSGGISGTAQAAALAVEELREEFPDRQIEAIDTYAASLGEGMQVLEAARMREEGASFNGIVQYILARRQNMCQYFTVDDLEYLRRGGRISRVASAVGTVLKIKPILTGNEEGRIVMCGKARGRRPALIALAEEYDKLAENKTEDIGIAHADDEEGVAILLEELRKRGFVGEYLSVVYEPVTGAHVGPGTVALFFRGVHK